MGAFYQRKHKTTSHTLALKLTKGGIVPKIEIQMTFICNDYRLINNMHYIIHVIDCNQTQSLH